MEVTTMSRNKYIHDRAKYETIVSDGVVLEAVFRLQTAHTKKRCDADHCGLGREILPYQDYARVYFEDEDKVEMFHYGCFRREFKPDA